jgi:hypothetical protein
MDIYKIKYLKYKNKYLNFKNTINSKSLRGGSKNTTEIQHEITTNVPPEITSKIPNILWAIWLDFKNCSDGSLENNNILFFINNINRIHSTNWEVNIITSWDVLLNKINNNIDITQVLNNEYISPAHKSDLLRYYLLKIYGGFWIDITTYCLTSIDNMISLINKNNKNNISFLCYYTLIDDVTDWIFKSTAPLYEYTDYNDRIIKWAPNKKKFISLKKTQKLYIMPENYFIGAIKDHSIINTIYDNLIFFWKSNISNITNSLMLCNIQSNYIYNLINTIFNIQIDKFFSDVDKEIIKYENIDKINYFITKEISDCGYLFNYLQMYIVINNYITNSNQSNNTNDNTLKVSLYNSLCIKTNCDDIFYNINNDNNEHILLISATYNRLYKWSNNRDNRISWDDTFLGNYITDIISNNNYSSPFASLINNGIYLFKFASITRNCPIINKLKIIEEQIIEEHIIKK